MPKKQQEGVDGNDDLRLPIQEEVSCCNACQMFVENLHCTMFGLFAMQTVDATKVDCLVTAKGPWLTGISFGASFTARAQQNHSGGTSHAHLPPDKGGALVPTAGPKVSHAPRPMQYASRPLSLPSHCTSLEGTGSRGCIIVAHPLLILKVRGGKW